MTPKELHEYFYVKKPDLDRIISKLEVDQKFDSLFHLAFGSEVPNIKRKYPNEFNILKKCGVTHLSSQKNSFPKGTNWYYIETNWPGEAPILLSYNIKNTDEFSERQKGFYRKDEYSNEWWGLGEGWQMLQLVKEIDYIKQ